MTSHVLRVANLRPQFLPPIGSSPMPLAGVRSVLTTMASSWREHVPRDRRVLRRVRVIGVAGQGVQAVEPHLHHTLRLVRGLRRARYHLGTPIHPRVQVQHNKSGTVPRHRRVLRRVRVIGVTGQGVQAVEPHLHHTLRLVCGLRRARYHLGTPINPRVQHNKSGTVPRENRVRQIALREPGATRVQQTVATVVETSLPLS